MSLINEERTISESSEGHDGTIEYIPCLAAMSTYDDVEGNPVRYLSAFVPSDESVASTMTTYFDDEQFRQTLRLVLLVGYEWKTEDPQHFERYFRSFQLNENVDVKCIQPSNSFESLQDEFQFFKSLNDEDKARKSARKELGPGRMAQWVLEMARTELMQLRQQQEVEAAAQQNIRNIQIETKEHASAGNEETAGAIVKQHLAVPNPKPMMIDPAQTLFACRICRTVLLGEDHLANDHVQNLHSFNRRANAAKGSVGNNGSSCQSLFCDEIVLTSLSLLEEAHQMEGRLHCPKCSTKLGHWNWSGAQCSCGTWVVPAIQIPLSKVDTIVPRNMASTAESSSLDMANNPQVVLPRILSTQRISGLEEVLSRE